MRINGRALQAAVTAAAAALLSASAAHADTTPIGTWIDHTGRGAVEIKDCDGQLCGYVAWVKDSKDAEGCGEQIIGNVKKVGSQTWDNGWIYDPDRGKKFDVEIRPIGEDKLRVTGYAGIKWLSETMTWKRAPADLEKCTKTTSTEAAVTKPEKASVVDASEPKDAKAAESTSDTDLKAAEVAPDAKSKTETDANKPAKMAATTPDDEADDTASAVEDDANDDTADTPKKGKAGEIVARIADELGVKVNKEGPKAEGGKKTCRMRVPYVDMTVTFPCDG